MTKLQSDELRWYEFPHYYDLGFRDETKPEVDFFEAAFAKYATGEVRKVLEPGCGSGRLVVELAKRGYEVHGFDLSEPAIRYASEQLAKKKLAANLSLADMSSFNLREKFDAATNTFNTFRHLLTESDAIGHMKSVAKHVRKGGLFILGLHLLPPDIDLISSERWRAKEGKTEVVYTLRVLSADRRTRLEHLRISMLIKRGVKRERLRAEFSLRMYTASQIKSLLAKTPEWQLLDVFDFWYDIEEPLRLNNDIADTVLVLKRR